MNQEYLTPAEQNHLQQGFLATKQDDSERAGEESEKILEGQFVGHQHAHEHQEGQQKGEQQQEGQEVVEGDGPPDPQKDFMGYMQWLGKTLHKQELLQAEQQQNSLTSEAQQLQAFFQQSVASVKQKHHDFDQAADFIYETRAKQLAAVTSLYPEMADPKAIDEVIGNELKQILRVCAQKNQNPAEVIYSIAQKIGYTNGANDAQKDGGQNWQERQNAARTLAAYNGLTPSGPISLEMLDKMTEAEFNLWVSDPKNKAAFNRLMGGADL